MDKQTFYNQLSEKLSEVGVGKEYISRHLRQFDGYFEGKSDEEISAEIDKLGSLDKLATRIKRMTDKLMDDEKREAEIKQNAEASAASKDEASPKAPADDKSATGEIRAAASDSDSANVDQGAVNNDKDIFENYGIDESEIPSDISLSSDDSNQTSMLDKEVIKKNTKKFWIIFASTLPITAAIIFAIAFSFASVFFLMAVLIIISVALLVGITAIGTVASVFGLIFGVVQMVTSLPVGLYECGISIIIGASFMLVGILVYNFAVRLMPFAAKMLLRFAKYVIKSAKELYIYLKKGCIGA